VTQARSGLEDDPVCGGNRFLFAAPQDGNMVLGTWYKVSGDGSRKVPVEQGVRSLLREFNQACPGLELSSKDVAGCQWGWLPLKGSHERGRPTALAQRPLIIDHGPTNRVQHLLSVEGVKYTTARRVAERVVDWVFRDLGRTSPPCRTAEVRLDTSGEGAPLQTDGTFAKAAVHRAVHEEMALKLSDIVFRRAAPMMGIRLSRTGVAETARLAGAELGWDTIRQEAEIEDVMRQAGPLRRAEETVG
jgi:glycerol-3-phosphate dehydrogenase